jgi:hypothetical protein
MEQIDFIGTQATVLDEQLFLLPQRLPRRENSNNDYHDNQTTHTAKNERKTKE